MLKELRKMLGKAEKAEEVVETVTEAATEEVVVEAVETVETVIEAAADPLAALETEFAAFKETAEELLATQKGSIAELTQQLADAKAALEVFAAEKAEAQAAALAAKLAARKEKIVAAIGTEKSDALMTATEGLDDAAFEAVVSALNGSVAVEANSSLFKEVGVAAVADASKVEESAEMKLLKQKYGKN